MRTVYTGLVPGRLRRAGLAVGLLTLFGGVCFLIVSQTSLLPYPAFAAEPPAPVTETGQPARKTAPLPTAETPAAPDPEPILTADISGRPPKVPAAVPLAGEAPDPYPTPAREVSLPVAAASGQDSSNPPSSGLSWDALITRLAVDGFDPAETRALFTALGSPPLREFMGQKAVELYGRYGKAVLNTPEAEPAKFAPPDYTRIAGGMTVAAGRRTINNNKKFFEGLYKRYSVPAPFIVAVMMVETGLGAETGKQSALHALGSMSVTDSLGHVLPVVTGIEKGHEEMNELIKARSDWAYNELKELIRYAGASGKDAATIPGSVYGAIGICQFMPSNIEKFAVSTSKQRPVPDIFTFSDAAASVARYLSAHGWKKALTPGAQVAVLRSYNHSDIYASTVYGVASSLMSPTTHLGAENARKGGNAVKAARQSARDSIPSGSKKAKPVEALPSYSDLLK